MKFTVILNKLLFAFITIFACNIQGYCQIQVSSKVAESPYDISARTEKRLDLNGMGCALLKIELPVENVTFEGNVVGAVKYTTNEYWIYMTDGSKKLKVHAPGQPNLMLEFAPLVSLRTYSATLSVPTSKEVSIADAVFNYERRAKSILADTTVITNLRRESYRHMQTVRDVSHIMLFRGVTPDERMANSNKMDSIRQAIVNGASFEEMAQQYSVDKQTKDKGGRIGWINHEVLFPYTFIEAAYATEVGGISAAFDDTRFGFHIIKVNDEKTNPGLFKVRHILKTTVRLSEAEVIKKKTSIDSIYTLLLKGRDFDAMAKAESEDPGSAKLGGELQPFGLGMMVPEFEQAVLSLKDGEMSKPFKTSYGYHIVQRLKVLPFPSYEERLPLINAGIAKYDIKDEPRKDKLAKLRTLYGIKPDKTALTKAHEIIKNGGGINPTTISKLKQDNTLLAKFGHKTLSISDIANALPEYNRDVKQAGESEFDRVAYEQLDVLTEDIVRIQLEDSPEYLKYLDPVTQ